MRKAGTDRRSSRFAGQGWSGFVSMVDLLASDHLIHEVLESPISRALQAEIDDLVRGIVECGVQLKRIHLSGNVLFLAAGQAADAYFTVGRGSDGPELRLVALTAPGVAPDRDHIAMVVGGSAEGPWTTQIVSPSEPLKLIEARTEPQELPSHTPWRVVTSWKPPEDLALRLTPIQHRLLYARRPLLIQGVAGAGKTTILAHMAQRRLIENPAARVLLVTYTPQLRQYLISLVAGLFDGRVPRELRVLDWRGLCDHIATSLGLQPFNWFGKADVSFSYAWTPSTRHESLTRQVGEEIRSVLKGNNIDLDRPMLSREDYLNAPETCQQNERILDEALRYQAHLEAHGQVDDMDAARKLLQHKAFLPRFDHVLVDETQDLTMIQLWLVAQLAAIPEGLAFAGDDCQVVHPSKFSWNRVRDALHRVGINMPPMPTYLETNHRCPRPVMELALRVAGKRARRLGEPVPHVPTNDRPALPIPVRLAIAEPELERVLTELAATVASLGIIQTQRSWSTSEQWSFQGVGFRRSFTPQSVKGIEFDVTVLLRFGRDYKHLTTAQQNKLTDEQYAFTASEVYVSITRTRGLLIALDVASTHRQLWHDPELSQWFEVLESIPELLERIKRGHSVDGPKGWRRAAIDFEHQNAYEAAAECWQRAGNMEKAARAFDLAGRLDVAAPLYRDIGLIEDAADAFSRGGRNAEAADCLEGLHKWESAAKEWEKCGRSKAERRRAAIAWSLAERPELAAPHFEAASHWGEAAACWQEVGATSSLRLAAVAWGREGYTRCEGDANPTEAFVRAAGCWSGYFAGLGVSAPEMTFTAPSPADFTGWLFTVLDIDPNTKDSDFTSVAEKFEDLRLWSEAAAAWRRADRPVQAARAHIGGRDLESARSVLSEGRHDASRDSTFDREEAAFWAESAKRLEAGKDHELAAIAANEAATRFKRAGEAYRHVGQWESAAEMFEDAGDFRSAVDAWKRAKATRKNRAPLLAAMHRAGEAYCRVEQWESAAEMFEEAGDIESAVAAWKRAKPTRKNGVRLLAAMNRAGMRDQDIDH